MAIGCPPRSAWRSRRARASARPCISRRAGSCRRRRALRSHFELNATSVFARSRIRNAWSRVGLRVGRDLLARERRPRHVAPGRVADQGGEVADQENDVVTEVLQLAQLVELHGVAQMQVGARRIEAFLDRAAACRARASCASSASTRSSSAPRLKTASDDRCRSSWWWRCGLRSRWLDVRGEQAFDAERGCDGETACYNPPGRWPYGACEARRLLASHFVDHAQAPILAQPFRTGVRAVAHVLSPGRRWPSRCCVWPASRLSASRRIPRSKRRPCKACRVRCRCRRSSTSATIADRYWREERVQRGDTIGSLLARAAVDDAAAHGIPAHRSAARAALSVAPGRAAAGRDRRRRPARRAALPGRERRAAVDRPRGDGFVAAARDTRRRRAH